MNHSMDAEEEARLFHEGIELFNSGEWFEAHEVWEDIWHHAGGEKKQFYQGLIQLAVTIEHIRRGNPRGVVQVFESATRKFTGLPEKYMGIDITSLVQHIAAMVEPIRKMPSEVFKPRVGRGLDMPVDLAAVPKIALEYDPFEQDAP